MGKLSKNTRATVRVNSYFTLRKWMTLYPVWPQRTWAENWGMYTFRGGAAGSPSNTMSPGPRLGWVGLDFSNSVRFCSVFNLKYSVSVFSVSVFAHHHNARVS